MASLNIKAYFGLVSVVVCVLLGFLYVGNSLAEKENVKLDESSQEYLINYAGVMAESGIEEISNQSIINLKESSVTQENDNTGTNPLSDFLAPINWARNKIAQIEYNMKIVTNAPEAVLFLLGFDKAPWLIYTGAVVLILALSLIVILVREIK